MSWMLLPAAVGLVAVILAYRYRPWKTCANSAKDTPFYVVGGLLWLSVLYACLSLDFSPKTLSNVAFIWFIIASFGWIIYDARHGGDLAPASLAHVPVTIRFWLCYVRVPATVASRVSAAIEIGLTSHTQDLAKGGDRNAAREMVEQFEAVGGALSPPRFDEMAMVAGGGLLPASTVAVRVWGPAFRVEPENRRVTIEDLVRRPVQALLKPLEDGDHAIRVEFHDVEGRVRGGMTVPVRVSPTPTPRLPNRTASILKYAGAILYLASLGTLLTTRVIELREQHQAEGKPVNQP